MANDKYNGWTNRATWLVQLWLDNEQGTQVALYDIARSNRESLANTADGIKDYIEELLPELDGFAADLMSVAIGEVNWSEIAEHAIENLDEQE